MKKPDAFFVISNYNTDPSALIEYSSEYWIYDQSPDAAVRDVLRSKYQNLEFVENTGHNLSDYFRFFVDRWDSLPDLLLLTKGNMIGRHVTEDYFRRVYLNAGLTWLYEDRRCVDKPGVAYQFSDGCYLETNTSWYGRLKPHRYFSDFNLMLKFVFKDPVIPEWLVFCPGVCCLLPKAHVLRYPREFWVNLKRLVSYTYFPAEAYIVERMFPLIVSGVYELNPWMTNVELFMEKLADVERAGSGHLSPRERLVSKLKSRVKRIGYSFVG